MSVRQDDLELGKFALNFKFVRTCICLIILFLYFWSSIVWLQELLKHFLSWIRYLSLYTFHHDYITDSWWMSMKFGGSMGSVPRKKETKTLEKKNLQHGVSKIYNQLIMLNLSSRRNPPKIGRCRLGSYWSEERCISRHCFLTLYELLSGLLKTGLSLGGHYRRKLLDTPWWTDETAACPALQKGLTR